MMFIQDINSCYMAFDGQLCVKQILGHSPDSVRILHNGIEKDQLVPHEHLRSARS